MLKAAQADAQAIPPRMFVHTAPLVLLAANLVLAVPTALDQADDVVTGAIEHLQDYLYANQDPGSGTWEKHPDPASPHFGGVTSLVVAALLTSGEPPQNRSLARAIEFLKDAPLQGTYEVAVRAHVWAALPDTHSQLLRRDAQWLLDAHDGYSRFRYHPRPASYDHSATQYALLGLWEASKRGVKIPNKIWRNARDHFIRVQNNDGGWGYTALDESKASMTAAGLTVLYIVQQQLHRHQVRPPPKLAAAIQRGLKWLDLHFDPARNRTASGADAHHLYYFLYSIERVGLASGVRFFHRRDWYTTGASVILETMVNSGRHPSINNDLVDTAFALMFLARGRVQNWMTKLTSADPSWNNRPNDINNLTTYLSDMREAEINWQSAHITTPADALIDSPVAYLASERPIELDEEQLANLNRYLDLGGMILANPDNVSTEFSQSIRRIAARLYPQWPMRRLPRDHPIYNTHDRVNDASQVFGVSNGVRELILLAERDWGMGFQADRVPGASSAWKIAGNLYTIVTNRGRMPGRLLRPFERRRPGPGRGQITVARAHPGPDELTPPLEPAAWQIMADRFFNRSRIEIKLIERPLIAIENASASLVHLAGAEAVQLADGELASLLAYARDGGTVLIETVGGHGDFARAVEKQLDAYTGQEARALTSRSPIISGSALAGAYDNRKIKFHRYAVMKTGLGQRNRLAAYNVEGRPAIIVSHEDLTLGVMGVRHWGILGYQPESARRLMTNILLWAMGNGSGKLETGRSKEQTR